MFSFSFFCFCCETTNIKWKPKTVWKAGLNWNQLKMNRINFPECKLKTDEQKTVASFLACILVWCMIMHLLIEIVSIDVWIQQEVNAIITIEWCKLPVHRPIVDWRRDHRNPLNSVQPALVGFCNEWQSLSCVLMQWNNFDALRSNYLNVVRRAIKNPPSSSWRIR